MPLMPPLAIDRFLVPEQPAIPGTLARVRQDLVRGVPFEWPLTGDLSLALVFPTGNATLWRDADPASVVSEGSDELAPHAPPRGADALERSPARLIVRQARAIRAVVPVAAGLSRIVPDGGEARTLVELAVIAWRLHAGTIRGAGDYGSFVEVGWRRVGKGAPEIVDLLRSGISLGGYLP
jgi:hypothetical protein